METFSKVAAADAPAPEKMLGEAVLAAQNLQSVRVFVNECPDAFKSMAGVLTGTLNAECSTKAKTSALVVLANFSKYKVARDELYHCLKRVDTVFEETLLEKERASGSFGTALGKLHATMLVLMMRVFSYRVGGLEILEYSSGKTSFALDLVVDILKVPSYEVEVTANCCTALSDLSRATKESAATEVDKKEFFVRVELFTDSLMRHNLVAIASAAIKRCLKSASDKATTGPDGKSNVVILPAAVHSSLYNICRTILNLYAFSSQGNTATALRQSLLVATDLLTSTIPRYINAVCDEVYRCVDPETGVLLFPITSGLAHGVAQALRVMALGTFHLGHHCHALRPLNLFTCRLLGLPFKEFVSPNLEVYALLLHFNVNIDSLGGEHGLATQGDKGNPPDILEPCTSAVIIRMVGQLLGALSKADLDALWKLVAQNSGAIPLARDNISYDLLSHLFEVALAKREDSGEPTEAESPKNAVDMSASDLDALDARMQALEASRPDMGPVREKLLQTPPAEPMSLRLLGDLPTLGAAAPASPNFSAPPAVQSGPLEGIEGPAPSKPALPRRAEEVWATAVEDLTTPRDFLCCINGHLLKHPVRCPTGEVFEKETIETWLKKVGSTNPITGGTLMLEQLQTDDELANRILEWQITQNVAANDSADDLYQF